MTRKAKAAYRWLTHDEGWMFLLTGTYLAAVAATLVSFLYVFFFF